MPRERCNSKVLKARASYTFDLRRPHGRPCAAARLATLFKRDLIYPLPLCAAVWHWWDEQPHQGATGLCQSRSNLACSWCWAPRRAGRERESLQWTRSTLLHPSLALLVLGPRRGSAPRPQAKAPRRPHAIRRGGGQDGSIGPTCVFAVLLENGTHVVPLPQH